MLHIFTLFTISMGRKRSRCDLSRHDAYDNLSQGMKAAIHQVLHTMGFGDNILTYASTLIPKAIEIQELKSMDSKVKAMATVAVCVYISILETTKTLVTESTKTLLLSACNDLDETVFVSTYNKVAAALTASDGTFSHLASEVPNIGHCRYEMMTATLIDAASAALTEYDIVVHEVSKRAQVPLRIRICRLFANTIIDILKQGATMTCPTTVAFSCMLHFMFKKYSEYVVDHITLVKISGNTKKMNEVMNMMTVCSNRNPMLLDKFCNKLCAFLRHEKRKDVVVMVPVRRASAVQPDAFDSSPSGGELTTQVGLNPDPLFDSAPEEYTLAFLPPPSPHYTGIDN